jgi:anti-sigma B factor antagonist
MFPVVDHRTFQPFSLATVSDGAHTVIELSGEFDMAVEPALSKAFANAFDTAPRTITVDLRKLEFLDSSGLHALLRARDACAALGCRLILVRPSRPVLRVFEVTGVSERFTFVDTIDSAGARDDVTTAG